MEAATSSAHTPETIHKAGSPDQWLLADYERGLKDQTYLTF